MENRSVRRRGAVLVVTLVVAASLGLLLTICAARWDFYRRRADDAALHSLLENAALDMLERVTAWTLSRKPPNPVSGGYDVVAMEPSDGLERLEIELPQSLRRSLSGSVAVRCQLHWCLFTPPSSLNWRIAPKDYPPSLAEALRRQEERVFAQSFEQSSASAIKSAAAERGAYRITVTASLAEGNDGNEGNAERDGAKTLARRVILERLLTVYR